MGPATAGARLGYTGKEAAEKGSELLNNFFAGFTGVKQGIDASKEFLREHGYVEDFVGRRRHLPDINLDPYTVTAKTTDSTFNPFIGCTDRQLEYREIKIWEQIIDMYRLLAAARKEAFKKVKNSKGEVTEVLNTPIFVLFDNPATTKEQKQVYLKRYYYDELKLEFNNDTFKMLQELALHPYKFKTYTTKVALRNYPGIKAANDINGNPTEDEKVVKNNKATTYRTVLLIDKIIYDSKIAYQLGSQNIYYNDNFNSDNYHILTRKAISIAANNYLTKYRDHTTITADDLNYLSSLTDNNGSCIISANTGRIAQAARQCFNARIQGSAASLTKIAMVDIENDEILNKCNAHLIITVHDEVLVECPAYYADIVEKRLPEVMINAAKKAGNQVPQACDPYNVTRWYCDEMAATLLDEYKKAIAKGLSEQEALNKIYTAHTEIPKEAIDNVISGKTEQLEF